MLLLYSAFFILSTCIVSSVSELMCFDCNSLYDGTQCEMGSNLNGLSMFAKPCTGKNSSYIEDYEKPLCRKIEQRIKTRNNMRIIKRSCGYELYQKREDDLCYKYRTEDHEEVVCQCFGHLCNGAGIKSSNHYWTIAYFLIIIFRYFK